MHDRIGPDPDARRPSPDRVARLARAATSGGPKQLPQRRVAAVQALQRAAGNHAVLQLLAEERTAYPPVTQPVTRQADASAMPVVQTKWISDDGESYVWDRQLDGLRWHYLVATQTLYFTIEGQTPEKKRLLEGQFRDLQGRDNARSYDAWLQAGFVAGNWTASDREIVPFRAQPQEKVKLANVPVEVP